MCSYTCEDVREFVKFSGFFAGWRGHAIITKKLHERTNDKVRFFFACCVLACLSAQWYNSPFFFYLNTHSLPIPGKKRKRTKKTLSEFGWVQSSGKVSREKFN